MAYHHITLYFIQITCLEWYVLLALSLCFLFVVTWIFNYWILKKDYDDEAKLYLIRKHLKISQSQFDVSLKLWRNDVNITVGHT